MFRTLKIAAALAVAFFAANANSYAYGITDKTTCGSTFTQMECERTVTLRDGRQYTMKCTNFTAINLSATAVKIKSVGSDDDTAFEICDGCKLGTTLERVQTAADQWMCQAATDVDVMMQGATDR